jgi:hypothetical protein
MRHDEIVAVYREIETLNNAMINVVRIGHWDLLIDLGAQIFTKIESVQKAGGFSHQIDEDARQESVALINTILRTECNVRQAIEAKMSDLKHPSTTTREVERKLSQAYGVPYLT